MKKPQPDIGDILKASYISNLGGVRKFKRLWGTTTVNGVEVLKQRQYYYPSSSRASDFEVLFKYLGIYDSVTSSEPKGVRSAWIYLNKNKGSALPVETQEDPLTLYKEFVANNLNRMWWDYNDGPLPEDLTLTTSVVIEAKFNTTGEASVFTTDLLDPNSTKEELIEDIKTHYNTLWDTCRITQQGVGVINKGSFTDDVTNVVTPDEDDLSPDDPWLATIARYALRSNDLSCTVKDVELGYGKTEAGRYYYTYVIDIEIPYTSFTAENNSFVSQIASDLLLSDTVRVTNLNRKRYGTVLSISNEKQTKNQITAMDFSDLQDDPELVTRTYELWEDVAEEVNTVFGSIWIYGNGAYYLKADALTNPRNYGIKAKDLSNYLFSLIDSGYQKKKTKWWKKILAIVVAVIIVWFYPPAGYWAAAYAAGAATTIALFITAVSLVLTLLTVAFSVLGMEELATAFAEVNKMIEPLVTIASIVLIVNSLTNAYKKALEKAGGELTKEAVSEVIKDYIKDMAESIITDAKDLFAGNLNSGSLNFASKLAQLGTMPYRLRLESINDRNKDLKAEYEDLIKEMAQENDLLRGFARIYAKPATADWSMYAATFDHPYERGGGPLHIGNIQRTTKQAIRRGSYDDPTFDNILVV